MRKKVKEKVLKSFKKFSVCLLSLMMLFTNMATVNANDYSGTLYVAQNDTGLHYVGGSSKYGILSRKVHIGNWADAKTVFCIEHGKELATGTYVDASYSSNMSVELQQATRIAYLGWYSKHGDVLLESGNIGTLKYDYAFTQMMIWESQGTGSTFTDSSVQARYESFKTDINNQIAQKSKLPSFDGGNIEMNAGDTVTLTDTNGVLSGFNSCDGTLDGIRFEHTKGSNDLKITVSENCNTENFILNFNKCRQIGLYRHDGGTDFRHYHFGSHQQNIYSNYYPDDPVVSLSMKINLYGKLELTKTNDKDQLVDGSVFKLKGKTNGYEKDVTVQNGKILVEQIPHGEYTLVETKRPNVNNTDGAYKELTGEVFDIEIKSNQTTTKTVVNEEKIGTVNFKKTLAKTSTGLFGDATVDATYKLTVASDIKNANGDVVLHKGDNAVDRLSGKDISVKKADSNGNITWTNLWLGNYTITEVEASTGTLLNKGTVSATPVSNVAGTSNEAVVNETQANTVKQQPVEVFKEGIGQDNHASGKVTGLNGAEFTIKLQSEVNKVGWDNASTYDVVTTKNDDDGASGYATTKPLPYGVYVLRETKTPEGYIKAPDLIFSITKDSDKAKKIAINNDMVSAYIKMIKKDAKTGKTVSLNGTSFKIKNRETGKYVTQKVGSTTYDVFTTNSKNRVVLDKNYYSSDNDLKGEVVTPLKLISGKYQVEEVGTPKGFLDAENPVEFNVLNEVDLTKDDDGDNLVTVVVRNEQPTGTLKINKTVALDDKADLSLVDTSDLSGIEFTLTAKEDVIDMADGSIIYKKGAVVGKYNLNKDGTLKVENLPIGKYELQETKTLNNLVLNDKVYDVTFTQKDTKTKVYTETKAIENQPTKTKISKQTITGEKELEGATLQIVDKDNKVVAEWVSTDKTYYIEGLAKGDYTLVETLAPNEYVISSNVNFSVDDSGKVHQVKMVDKQVKFTKTDVTGEKEVEGAEITVTEKETNEVVDKWTSGKDAHYISGLKEGKTYVLSEVVSPEGYVKSTDIEFTVTTDKETQKVNMKDKRVEFTKTDVTGEKEVEGAEITVTDKETNEVVDKWTSGKDKHYISGLEEGKTYVLSEVTAPSEYVKATDVEFTVTKEKVDQKTTMIDKQLIVSKTNFGGEEIQGASMQIIDKEGNVVDEWISTDETHYASGLAENETYTLHEDLAPLGYNVANDFEFTVTTDKETQKETMVDNVVNVKKVDNEGNLLKGATLQVVSTKTKNIVDKWVTGQHIFDITKEMKATLEKDGKVENMYVGDEDSTVQYSIVKNKGKDDYTLMLVKEGEVNYYNIDKDGNETSHMVRGLLEGEEYKLVEVKAPKKYVIAKSKTFTTKEKDINLELTDKQVTVKKTDLVNGKEVEGAELVVTDKETGKEIDKWTSGKDEHYVECLEEGKTYILTEKTAPKGYYVAESIEFTVSSDKEIQKVEMKDAPILTNIQVNKIDKETRKAIKSKDFAFTMYEDEECTKEIETVHANKEDGTATFKDVRYGTVYIKETQAPTGYLLSNEVKKVVLDDNLENVGKTYSFEYVNTLKPIIKTGDDTNVKGLLALGGLSGIVLISSAVAYRRKKSKKQNA